MKHPAASGWLPSKWPDAMPVHTSQAVSVIVMLIALTFIFIGMMPSNGVRHVRVAPPSNILSSNIPSSITTEGRQYLHELSQRASNLSKDQAFLRDAAPSISRIRASMKFGGENCSCNQGAYTFADFDYVEAQLLKPGKIGARSIQRVSEATSQGRENIKTVYVASWV